MNGFSHKLRPHNIAPPKTFDGEISCEIFCTSKGTHHKSASGASFVWLQNSV